MLGKYTCHSQIQRAHSAVCLRDQYTEYVARPTYIQVFTMHMLTGNVPQRAILLDQNRPGNQAKQSTSTITACGGQISWQVEQRDIPILPVVSSKSSCWNGATAVYNRMHFIMFTRCSILHKFSIDPYEWLQASTGPVMWRRKGEFLMISETPHH